MAKYLYIVLGILLLSLLLYLIDFTSPSYNQSTINTSIKENNLTNSLDSDLLNKPYADETERKNIVNASNYKNDVQKVIGITKNILLDKYNIKISDDDIRFFIKDRYNNLIDDNTFIEMKENLDAQIAAAEDIVFNNANPNEAAERYLKKWGGASAYSQMLSSINKTRLEEMKKMLPSNINDMYEKSISGHRDTVELYELAKIILNDKNLGKNSTNWQVQVYNHIIQYAKDNLIGKIKEFDNINPNDLQYTSSNYNLEIIIDSDNLPPLERDSNINDSSMNQSLRN